MNYEKEWLMKSVQLYNQLNKLMLPFDKLPDAIEAKWIQLAMSTAEFESLDDNSKVILATLSNKIWEFSSSTTSKMSEAEKTRIALGNPEYKKHLEAKKIAREEMLRHKAELNWMEIAFDYYRAQNANERSRISFR